MNKKLSNKNDEIMMRDFVKAKDNNGSYLLMTRQKGDMGISVFAQCDPLDILDFVCKAVNFAFETTDGNNQLQVSLCDWLNETVAANRETRKFNAAMLDCAKYNANVKGECEI